jgi:Short C-terminal domain
MSQSTAHTKPIFWSLAAIFISVFPLARRRPGGPLDTLKGRYANGELSAEEYQERKRFLEGS